MSELPTTWTSTTLGLVSQITTGNTPSTKISSYFGGSHPFVKPGDLDRRLPIVETVQTLSDAGAANARLVRPGAVLVSCIGNLGKIGIAGKPLATNQQINAVEFHATMIDDRYGYYYCCTLKTWMEQSSSATTVAILNKGRFSLAPIDVAPLAEQKRIANQLDTLLTRVQACNDRFDAIPALLKRFRQTVLDAALNGGFSIEVVSLSSRKSYPKVRLSEVAESRLGKMLDKQKNSGTPTPYIGNINVRWFSFDLESLQFISIDDREKAGLEIRDGDVFICEGGEPGRCAIWNMGPTNIVFQKALHRVRPVKERLLSLWLAYCIRHMTDTEQLKPLYTGTTIRHLTGASLSQVLLPLPSVEEQTAIVRRVEALFALADRIEARCTAARAQAQRLTPLVLAKAFRGELVPQDPNDEPASELLARIASLDTAVAGKNKRKVPVALKEHAQAAINL